MAKRFIDTDIFKKGFIKSLNGAYKLFWVYIINDCNHAGIWEVDFDIAGIRCGFKYDQETAQKEFGDKIVIFDGGAKWFIPSFIEFQYGELNEKNRVHASIIQILKKYNLTKIKPLTSPLQGVKDKDMDKDMDMEKDEGGVGEEKPLAVILRLWRDAGFVHTGDLKSAKQFSDRIIGRDVSLATPEQLEELESVFTRIIEYVKRDGNTKFYGSFDAVNRHLDKILTDIKNGKRNGKQERVYTADDFKDI